MGDQKYALAGGVAAERVAVKSLPGIYIYIYVYLYIYIYIYICIYIYV